MGYEILLENFVCDLAFHCNTTYLGDGRGEGGSRGDKKSGDKELHGGQ